MFTSLEKFLFFCIYKIGCSDLRCFPITLRYASLSFHNAGSSSLSVISDSIPSFQLFLDLPRILRPSGFQNIIVCFPSVLNTSLYHRSCVVLISQAIVFSTCMISFILLFVILHNPLIFSSNTFLYSSMSFPLSLLTTF